MGQILTSLHGRKLGLDSDGYLVGDGFKGVRGGSLSDGTQQLDFALSDLSVFRDDFTGKAISGLWDVQKGSDGGTVNFAVNAQLGGAVRATTGAGAGASMAVNGVQLETALNWEADKTNLVFEARVRISAITTIALYVGLTDQVAALEMPMTLSGGSLTTNATDAVGFLFDTAATVANIKLCGVANDVDATFQTLTGVAPVAATYANYRINVDKNGGATFFINGLPVGTPMTGAVTKTIPLTPVVACFTRAAGSATVDVDYVYLQQSR